MEIKLRHWCGLEDNCNYGMHYNMPHRIIRDGGWENLLYIGFKDKNKKNIYIGDILLLNNKNYDPTDDIYYEGRVLVEETERLGYSLKPIDAIKEPFDSTSMWHVGEEDTTEIIGNKFENPGLMK